MTAAPDCRVKVAGVVFADTAADLEALEPTVLADVDLTWGRGNTVDQPAPATCRVAVMDRSGGDLFADVLTIGATLELHAAGDTAIGTPVDVAVDGGFEALALGAPPPGRVLLAAGSAATLTVVDAPTRTGVRALRLTSPASTLNTFYLPPAALTPGNPAGWDTIPRLGVNQWTWRLAVYGARNARVSVQAVAFTDPQTGALAGGVGSPVTVAGDLTWHTVTRTVAATTPQVDAWLGLAVTVNLATWDAPNPDGTTATTWDEMVGTWDTYGPSYVDDLELWAPSGGTVRDVLVFSGRITDLAGRIVDRAGTVRVDVTAVDQLADLENRYVGDTPWPSEPLSTRVGRIVTASAAAVDVIIDEPLGAAVVSWRDVDNQAAGTLLAGLAAGVDGVLWSATHVTTGAYLWIENVQLRAQVATLQLVGGVVVIVVDTESGRPAGRTSIDACQVDAALLTWIRDVSDLITRVDATWLEQTLDAEGHPAPTERTVRVADAAAEGDPNGPGVRRMGVATNLTTAAAATGVGDRILARTSSPQGRVDGLNWDLGLFPPAPGEQMAAALDLLDGTTRIGRGLIVDNATLWPGGGPIGLYLDGGRYTFDAQGWTLGLVGTPLVGMGASATWDDLDPTWTWDQVDPSIAWDDLYGVSGPLTRLEA